MTHHIQQYINRSRQNNQNNQHNKINQNNQNNQNQINNTNIHKHILSVFTPVVDPENYVIIESNENSSRDSKDTTEKHTRKSVVNEEKKPQKKRWDNEDKKRAVELSKTMGVTQAINFLTKQNPELFCRLAPSTLQYWISQAKGKMKDAIED